MDECTEVGRRGCDGKGTALLCWPSTIAWPREAVEDEGDSITQCVRAVGETGTQKDREVQGMKWQQHNRPLAQHFLASLLLHFDPAQNV